MSKANRSSSRPEKPCLRALLQPLLVATEHYAVRLTDTPIFPTRYDTVLGFVAVHGSAYQKTVIRMGKITNILYHNKNRKKYIYVIDLDVLITDFTITVSKKIWTYKCNIKFHRKRQSGHLFTKGIDKRKRANIKFFIAFLVFWCKFCASQNFRSYISALCITDCGMNNLT